MNGTERIEKFLSSNDLGLTGGHQAGIHVPKDPEILSFLPALHPQMENPRTAIKLTDVVDHSTWTVNYIYYNNRLRGGTRNEYRITGLTTYLRNRQAYPGDLIFLERLSELRYEVGIEARADRSVDGKASSDATSESTVLLVPRSWIVGKKRK